MCAYRVATIYVNVSYPSSDDYLSVFNVNIIYVGYDDGA